MMRILTTSAALTALAGTAFAGGLDRSGQPMDIIFQQGNYAEFSFASSAPSVTGTDYSPTDFDNVADTFAFSTGGIKVDLTDQFSLAFIYDQPYGADVFYDGDPGTSMLGGTGADAEAVSLTAIGRYRLSDRFSVHGGLRHQTLGGDITLSGLAYGGLSGYNVDLSDGSALGYVIGGAFEIPQYALRVALTYNSEITHTLTTSETVGGIPVFGPSVDTEIVSPASINLDFQTGLNPKTLLFGSVRYVKWSDLIISPEWFDFSLDGLINGDSISDLDDTVTYSLGVGRAITDKFSASVELGYEPEGEDNLVSPLAPAAGNWSITLGGQYKTEGVTVSGGVRYTKLGDARPEVGTPDTAVADFTDNEAVTIGFKVGFAF